jgi:hypothetical protein
MSLKITLLSRVMDDVDDAENKTSRFVDVAYCLRLLNFVRLRLQ